MSERGENGRAMASLSEILTNIYKPGDVVDASGIYRVTHDPSHTQPHEVTVIAGKRFPPCRSCAQPRFMVERLAQHVGDHEHFKS